MTDLPLPEPARVEWVPDDILPGSILTAYYTADQMLREREAYAAAKTAELQAECARLRGDANAWQDDAFTILGHAEVLRSQGETDMPAYFYGLAERICRVHVDEAHAQRMRELADAALRGKETP